jgi:hypothetical protein
MCIYNWKFMLLVKQDFTKYENISNYTGTLLIISIIYIRSIQHGAIMKSPGQQNCHVNYVRTLYLLHQLYVPLSSQISPTLLLVGSETAVFRYQSNRNNAFLTSCTIMSHFMQPIGNYSLKQLFQLMKWNYTDFYEAT